MKIGGCQWSRASKSVFNVALCGVILSFCVSVHAQQTKKVPRIGYVRFDVERTSGTNVEAFRDELRDLGYVEGTNIVIEYRSADGKPDRIPNLIAELAKLKVDVLISGDDPTIRVVKQVNKTIPIVMVINEDPVATGLVDSLARPGGNITGISRLTRELSGKRLELLTEIVPGMERFAVLWDGSSEVSKKNFKKYQAAALSMKLQLQSLEVREPNPDLDGSFRSAVKGRVNALITIGGRLINPYREQIVKHAIKHKLPSMYESSLWITPGGLISYSSNDVESYRRAAQMVDKILKGAKPADLPVQQPTKFELMINLKAAKKIGLTIPPNVLARADRVIK
jgi:putative ABC transport system substrate-binding protein